jgi:glycosyltransferase involved in cell wall biosynthesis
MRLMVLECNPSFGGGSEAIMLSLAQGLAARGHNICLLHDNEGSMLPLYRQFAAAVFQLRIASYSRQAPLSTVLSVARIGRLARKQRIDAIVSANLDAIFIGALLTGLYHIPCCLHLGLPATAMPASRFVQPAIKRLGATGAGIAPSRHTLDTWRSAGWPSHSLTVVPNWVDVNRFRPAADRNAIRAKLGISLESRCIVFVGRITREKGIEVLLRAFPKVRSRVSNAELIIVGPITAEYLVTVEKVIGSLDEADRRRVSVRPVSVTPEMYLAAADVACVPSSWQEPFGLALLEAMACSVPVVATTVGSFEQIIGECHRELLVSPDDPAALGDRLACLLDRPEVRANVGRYLRERVIKLFDPNQCVDAYETQLLKIVASAR